MIFIFELIGTIAFALSGAITAAEKKMDLLGVAIMGLTVATGGGIIRDLILGVTPPVMFRNPVYALVAIAVSFLVFVPFVQDELQKKSLAFHGILTGMDSIGLAVFTVVGSKAAYAACPDATAFLAIFVGVCTGVGGGVIKDVFAGERPGIFVKHFYATASIIGAILFVLLRNLLGQDASMMLSAVLICVLRYFATKYHWNLPHA